MNIGTKSVLYGAHCFFIHPWFVALGWWKLYGFRRVLFEVEGGNSLRRKFYRVTPSLWNPLLWVAFFVHDLGYWGKPNMDGAEGEKHPYWGAKLLYNLTGNYAWWCFVAYHSRFLAKQDQQDYSPLCVADKLAVPLEPWWLYLPRVIATGEIEEYMALAGVMNPESKYAGEPEISPSSAKYKHMQGKQSTRRAWFENMTKYMRAWVAEHKDGRPDTWTPDTTGGKRAVEDIGRRA